jgi:hypothetical protein
VKLLLVFATPMWLSSGWLCHLFNFHWDRNMTAVANLPKMESACFKKRKVFVNSWVWMLAQKKGGAAKNAGGSTQPYGAYCHKFPPTVLFMLLH